MTDIDNIIKLLDSFQYNISDYAGNNNYFLVDDHIELANHLIANNVIVQIHGHWEPECKNRRRCSNCGFGRNIEMQVGWNYCPNCGAKMDGEN